MRSLLQTLLRREAELSHCTSSWDGDVEKLAPTLYRRPLGRCGRCNRLDCNREARLRRVERQTL